MRNPHISATKPLCNLPPGPRDRRRLRINTWIRHHAQKPQCRFPGKRHARRLTREAPRAPPHGVATTHPSNQVAICTTRLPPRQALPTYYPDSGRSIRPDRPAPSGKTPSARQVYSSDPSLVRHRFQACRPPWSSYSKYGPHTSKHNTLDILTSQAPKSRSQLSFSP